MTKDKAGIVVLLLGAKTFSFAVPAVARQVRRLLEVAGVVLKDGNHYYVRCDASEGVLLAGVMQRLTVRHNAKQLKGKRFSIAAKKLMEVST